jgi:hypothetical protein
MDLLQKVKLILAVVQTKITSTGYHLLDRPENLETITALNFSHADIKKVLLELKPEDYYQGPLPDEMGNGLDMWVFGKVIKGLEIYIKFTMGRDKERVLLISFHKAKKRIKFPFRV